MMMTTVTLARLALLSNAIEELSSEDATDVVTLQLLILGPEGSVSSERIMRDQTPTHQTMYHNVPHSNTPANQPNGSTTMRFPCSMRSVSETVR